MFCPRHNPLVAYRLDLGGRFRKNQECCAQGVPTESGRPEALPSRQRLSGASNRWKFVSTCPAIRYARASPCAPTCCFASSREASSLPAQSSPVETSRSSRRIRKRIKRHQAETVVANGDPAGEGDDLRKGMGAGLLFCRGGGHF